MKYHVETVIEVPRHRVVELFEDPETARRWNTWHDDLDVIEQIAGEPGTVGATSRLTFGKVQMTETITAYELPERIVRTYETDKFYNVEENRFSELSDQRTLWRLDNEFRFYSFFMKVIGRLTPWAFKSETLRRVRRFKQLAEDDWRKTTAIASESPAP